MLSEIIDFLDLKPINHLNLPVSLYYISFILNLTCIDVTWPDLSKLFDTIPQESVLDPNLFIIFIDDMPQHISFGYKILFADNSTIEFEAWCQQNKLILIVTKLVSNNFYIRKNIIHEDQELQKCYKRNQGSSKFYK